MVVSTIIHALTPQQYKNDQNLFDIRLGNSIQTIPRECFQGCRNLKRITIPRSIKRIDSKAFADSGIEEVIFEENSCLRVISARCFQSCKNLTAITLPSTIKIIGDFSFEGCVNFRIKLTIHATIREIGVFAFKQSGLDQFHICTLETNTQRLLNTSVTTSRDKFISLNIGYGSFQQCNHLEVVNISSSRSLIASNDCNKESSQNSMSHIHPTLSDSIFSPSHKSNRLIINIGSYAFSDCQSLKSTTIDSTIKSLGRSTFADSNVEVVEFSQDSQLETIPEGMLERCPNIKMIKLSSSIKFISKQAFAYSGINDDIFTTLFTDSNIQHIGLKAFSYCKSLKSIAIPSSVKFIDERAFVASNLESVIFSSDSNLKTIHNHMFFRCSHLRIVRLPPPIKSIGSSSFERSGIDDESVTHMFSNCNIQHIRDYAFAECKNIRAVIFPSFIVSFGTSLFRGSMIEEVRFPPNFQLDSINNMFLNCCYLRIVRLPLSVRSLCESAFSGSSIDDESMDHMFTNCNIQHIGNFAFSHCKNLKSIVLPSSLKSIGHHAFQSSSIEEIIFPQDFQLEALPSSIFSDCERLQKVLLPSSIKRIENYAFFRTRIDDESITSIFLNSNIQHIGQYAFSFCKDITSIIIPPSVISLGKFAFSNSHIETIQFSQDSQLGIIPENMFAHCMNLRNIRLPPSIKSICSYAFYKSGIDDESLGDTFANCNIQFIGHMAFANCPNLESTPPLPSSIKSIDKTAFSNAGLKTTYSTKILSRCVIN